MYKKSIHHILFLLVAGLMVCVSASQSLALPEASVGDTKLNVYGFLRNNYGYFLEDQDYTINDDKLATNRTWLRTNIDWRFSDKFSLFASVQFVYEPEYDIEQGSISKPNGKEYSEYKEFDDVLREAYIDWRPSSDHSFRIGRQIVIWGESLTVKVGDVVNPENTRFTFAFANWEDTRIPQWMIKGLHYIENIDTSFEWLFSPNLVDEEYRVNRSGESAQPAAGELVGQRFSLYQENRFLPPYAVGNDGLHAFPPGTVAANPFSRGWSDLSFLPFIPGTGWVPDEIPIVLHNYPGDGMDDARFGFRTNTFLGGYEFGVSYYHTQIYNPVVMRSTETFPTYIPDPDAPQIFRNYYLVHPDVDYVGVYFNKDINVGLIRAEAIYSPNMSYNTFDQADFDAVVERDYYKYMLAWDLSGALYFDWHKSAPFDITIEHIAEYVPDNENIQNAIYGTELKKYKPSIGGRITTNWFYNLIQTDLIVSYGFKGRDGLFMPLIKWTPSWKNKAFSAELRYIGIFGDNNYEDLGMFRQKDMVVLTTQFNF
jgi:hypothetical protein